MILHTRRPDRSRLGRGRIRPARIALHAATAVAAGVLMALTQAGTGHADPSASEIEAQIDAQWNALEPVIEARNKLKTELDANRAKSKELAAKLAPLELQVNLALSRTSAISAQRYKGSDLSTLNSILATGSATGLADQLTLLNQMAHNQMLEIKDVVALKDQYDREKRPLDELLTEETRQEADLAAKEKSINDQIKSLNDTRLRVYGTTVASGNLRLAACPYDYTPDPGGRAAKVACAQIGKAYVFGSSGPNTFDCSGLTMYAWAQAVPKVQLRHYTVWQYEDTMRVTKDQLKPGDLVFYYSDKHHMGMYVGGGYVVHAPRSGDRVRMRRLDDGTPISGFGRPRT